MKLAAKALRASEPTKAQLAKVKRRDIFIICDNVLDTYNIGSIFRLADAVAAKCVYLCGESEIPPNGRIAKASVGTDKWVPWQYFAEAKTAIEDVRNRHPALDAGSRALDSRLRGNDKTRSGDDKLKSIKVIAIEQAKGSVDFRKIDYKEPIAFVVGHETGGVSKETLKVCDQIVEIPMFGVNVSLNVMVSLAIVLFRAI